MSSQNMIVVKFCESLPTVLNVSFFVENQYSIDVYATTNLELVMFTALKFTWLSKFYHSKKSGTKILSFSILYLQKVTSQCRTLISSSTSSSATPVRTTTSILKPFSGLTSLLDFFKPWKVRINLFFFRRWKVVSSPPVHGQAISASPRPDHRGRVRGPNDQHWRKANKASDLGYGKQWLLTNRI